MSREKITDAPGEKIKREYQGLGNVREWEYQVKGYQGIGISGNGECQGMGNLKEWGISVENVTRQCIHLGN